MGWKGSGFYGFPLRICFLTQFPDMHVQLGIFWIDTSWLLQDYSLPSGFRQRTKIPVVWVNFFSFLAYHRGWDHGSQWMGVMQKWGSRKFLVWPPGYDMSI